MHYLCNIKKNYTVQIYHYFVLGINCFQMIQIFYFEFKKKRIKIYLSAEASDHCILPIDKVCEQDQDSGYSATQVR